MTSHFSQLHEDAARAQGHPTTSSSGRLLCLPRLVVVVSLLATLAGCQRPLFNDKDPRSQFDTYDKLRQQNQSLLVPDEFGNPQPALRARLSPQS
ncbi:MAG: hypothetical protein ACKO4V_04250 [Planctomycetota bacterium]